MKDMKFVGRIVYNKGDVKFEGLPSDFLKMLRMGIVTRRSSPKILLADGMKVLEAVSDEFGRGSYFRATDIEEVKE
jgi:hypothetical protein